ncbi:MAG: glycosyltransferase [Spirochaetia bacterium]|nr:glycosyltransferase [Spirochaetia bacterium]
MKKIITGQFSDAIPPITDGVAFVAQNYYHYLNLKYGSSYLIGPDGPKDADEASSVIRFKSYEIPGFHPYRVGVPLLGTFRSALDSIDFDIIHSHTPFTAGHEAFRIAKRKNIPIIGTFHSKYKDDFAKALKSMTLSEQVVKYVVHYYEKMDQVWVPNEQTKEVLFSYGYQGNVEIVHNGTEMELLDEKSHTFLREKGRKEHGIGDDEILLLYVGQMREEKNLFFLINSIQQMHKEHLPIKVIFIGAGRDEDELKGRVHQKGLDSIFTFTGLIRDRKVLQSYFAMSDLYTFPSLYDNSSLTMKEAATCALPTIVIQGSTTSEGIIDEGNGFLIEHNVSSFVSKVKYLIEHPDIIKKAGLGAKNTLYISYESIVDEVYERYIKIIHDKTKK